MARPVVLTKQLTAASPNCIALSQTPVSGTPLTINGSAASSGVATLDTGRRVLVTFGSEAAQRTLTFFGTMEGGAQISEVMTIPATTPSSLATNQDFVTVTRIVPAGGGFTAPVLVGTNTVGATRWVVLNNHIADFQVGLQIQITPPAVANASGEQTLDSPLAPLGIYSVGYDRTPPVPVPTTITGMGTVTATSSGVISGAPVAAVRLKVNSGTDPVKMIVEQSGIIQT